MTGGLIYAIVTALCVAWVGGEFWAWQDLAVDLRLIVMAASLLAGFSLGAATEVCVRRNQGKVMERFLVFSQAHKGVFPFMGDWRELEAGTYAIEVTNGVVSVYREAKSEKIGGRTDITKDTPHEFRQMAPLQATMSNGERLCAVIGCLRTRAEHGTWDELDCEGDPKTGRDPHVHRWGVASHRSTYPMGAVVLIRVQTCEGVDGCGMERIVT